MLGAGLLLSACSTPSRCKHPIPLPPDAPDGQISDIAFTPTARCVLDVNDRLHVQFSYAVPEAPCQIFARLDLPESYWDFAEHGFYSGSSPCPPLMRGSGVLNQRFVLGYSPKRDKHPEDPAQHLKFLRFTNMIFSVRDIQNNTSRDIYSLPIDVTWKCAKQSFKDYRCEQDAAGWRQVKQFHPDATLIIPSKPAAP